VPASRNCRIAFDKIATPAATSTIPSRSCAAPRKSCGAIAAGQKRSMTRPATRAPRYIRGGRAITPGLSFDSSAIIVKLAMLVPEIPSIRFDLVWTWESPLRHPKFIALREDRSPPGR
jgi:hypothetical protein